MERAPALNVKSFLTDTTDLAIQQIITLGVPGTAMPVWGDRMTKSEIQAVVGFIRQWEPIAPEVATPTRGGGGGPP
ncbi:MAG: cytochrome c [Chloroflexi bacterium]|nr:cytochrome c [Chloroflexota bacterium]